MLQCKFKDTIELEPITQLPFVLCLINLKDKMIQQHALYTQEKSYINYSMY
jgi:hypothetical protein